MLFSRRRCGSHISCCCAYVGYPVGHSFIKYTASFTWLSLGLSDQTASASSCWFILQVVLQGAAQDSQKYKDFVQTSTVEETQIVDAPYHSTLCNVCQTVCHDHCNLEELSDAGDLRTFVSSQCSPAGPKAQPMWHSHFCGLCCQHQHLVHVVLFKCLQVMHSLPAV